VAGEALDYLNYLRFIINSMSPEEILPMFNPQIIAIHDYNLSDQAFPQVQTLFLMTIPIA
jgi:hypothetical protein